MTWLRVLNAAFLLLAACRALVPGLCATLAAQDANAAHHAACCRVDEAPKQDEGDGPRVHTVPPAHGPCAFCALMHGMVDAPEAVCLPVRPRLAFLEPEPHTAAPLSPTPRTHLGRAPPELA